MTSHSRPSKKLLIWLRAHGKCEDCGVPLYFKCLPETYTPGALPAQRHHIKYKSEGGGEELSNKKLVCASCHKKIHNINARKKRDIKRAQKRQELNRRLMRVLRRQSRRMPPK